VVVALTVLFLADWLDGLGLLVLSLPMPALVGTEEARIAPAAILSALVVAAMGIRIGLRRERLDLGALPVRGVALLGAALVLASVFAANHMVALRELINLGSMLGLLVVTTHAIGRGWVDRLRLVRLVAVSAGIAGVVAVAQMVGVVPSIFPMYGTPFNRATIGFGWPNESGLFFALALPACVLALRLQRGAAARAWLGAALAACGLGLVATFSRGSWLATLLAPLALVLAGSGKGALRAWLGCALLVVLLDLATGGSITGRAASLVGDYAVEQRGMLMVMGVLMFIDHPWVGVGPGGFGDALLVYGPQVATLTDYIGSAHNGYIEVAAETGVFGLIGFVVLLGGSLLTARRWAVAAQREGLPIEELRTREAILWMLAVVPLNAMTIWPFAHGTGQLIVLILAMAAARPSVPVPAAAPGRVPAAAAA